MGKESYFFQVSKLFVFSTICPFFLPKRVHTIVENVHVQKSHVFLKLLVIQNMFNFFRKIVFKKLVFYFKNIRIPKLLKIFKKMVQTIVENVSKSPRCIGLNIFTLFLSQQWQSVRVASRRTVLALGRKFDSQFSSFSTFLCGTVRKKC